MVIHKILVGFSRGGIIKEVWFGGFGSIGRRFVVPGFLLGF